MSEQLKLSTTSLKKKAKALAKEKNISLNTALNNIANQHGFTHWSTLCKNLSSVVTKNINSIYSICKPEKLIAIIADKNVGKTSFALNLATRAIENDIPCFYQISHQPKADILNRYEAISPIQQNKTLLHIEQGPTNSNALLDSLLGCQEQTFVILDYLSVTKETEPFLKQLKLLASLKSLSIIVLLQPFKSDIEVQPTLRQFHHALVLEHSNKITSDRKCKLVKSIHYKIQTNLINFNKENYQFDCERLLKSTYSGYCRCGTSLCLTSSALSTL